MAKSKTTKTKTMRALGRQPAARRRPTAATVTAAREALRRAIDRACIARGEAQWTNGYRAARFSGRIGPEAESERLYQKEMAQFRICGKAEAEVGRAIARFARVIRRG